MGAAKIVLIVALLLSLAITTAAQNQPLAFEVASVKEHVFDGRGGGFLGTRISGSLVTVSISTLKRLIQNAYQVQEYQVVGGPAWVNDNRPAYDITARAPAGLTPTPDQARQMLQTLFAERFKLTLHHETREMQGYVLSIGKNGSKLKPTAGDSSGSRLAMGAVRSMHSTNMAISQLIATIRGEVNGPVEDQTGLEGRYDFQLEWIADPLQSTAADTNGAAADLFTALQEQLGLKLEPMKTKVEVLIIDHAEKPLEN